MKKISEYAEAFGFYFEVPPLTRWITVDFRGYVFASISEEKPVVTGGVNGVPELWDHHGHGFYVGRLEIGGENWKEMIHPVSSSRFRVDRMIGLEIDKALNYCAERVYNSNYEDAEVISKFILMTSQRILEERK